MEALPSAAPPSQAGTWEEPRIWVVLNLRHPPNLHASAGRGEW
jgi:hypothetical protein